MTLHRRTFLHLAAGAAALPAASRMARAQAYPSRPVRIIVGFPAGGATDIQARLMGQWLSDRLGQQFIVENRGGASGNIATEAVARAPADGYTLLQIVTPHAINAALYSNLGFDFIRDIAPVICAARLAYVVVVNPSVPVTTIPEFIAYAKARPGEINYGSAGHGTPQNIACELFKMMAGVNLVHVPYRGGAPATSDLVGGHLHVIFSPISESIEHIKAGKLRTLAVTGQTRMEIFPEAPTMIELGYPDFVLYSWNGVHGPPGVPAEIAATLNKAIRDAIKTPEGKRFYDALGAEIGTMSAKEFGDFVAQELKRWEKIIALTGLPKQ
jgi:tripartite-type tricarboxylate transporter receptor subunit TctC